MSLLVLDRLSVTLHGREILRDLSLQVQPGERLGLVGKSGSGKTMTALAAMRLLPPDARLTGAVRFEGATLSEMTETQLCALRGRDIGMIFQEPMTALNPLMSIGDQVAETARAHGRASRAQARNIAAATLERVGLPAGAVGANRYPHELSGGQRQRVAIAIAVALAPKLLIADEPTSALDTMAQAQILDLLDDLVRESRMALMLISHDLDVLARHTDRIAVMSAGRVVERSDAESYCAALARLGAARRPAPSTGALPVLKATAVVREYSRVRAVDEVSISVEPGESVGIVGESAAGKSTLVRSLLALQALQGGQVWLKGESFSTATDAGDLRRLRRSIQAVFQDPVSSFDPRWRVRALIAEPLNVLKVRPNAAQVRVRVGELLEQVGLSSADADRYPHEFSGGQRQRIAIARALIVEPELIVFDEALSALDIATRIRILELLGRLSAARGLAYLWVSHDLPMIRAMTDRVYVMRAGRIVETGPTSRVFETPQHPYSQALFAAIEP